MRAMQSIGDKLQDLAGIAPVGGVTYGGILPEVDIELDDSVIQQALEIIHDVMSTGYAANKYVQIKSAGELNLKLTPTANGANITFARPYPKVNAVGGLVEMSITGIKRIRGGLVIELSGAPDLTVRFK